MIVVAEGFDESPLATLAVRTLQIKAIRSPRVGRSTHASQPGPGSVGSASPVSSSIWSSMCMATILPMTRLRRPGPVPSFTTLCNRHSRWASPRHAWRTNTQTGHGLDSAGFKFALVRVVVGGRLVHVVGQIERNDVHDEFAGLLNVGQRVLRSAVNAIGRTEGERRWVGTNGREIAVRRKIRTAVRRTESRPRQLVEGQSTASYVDTIPGRTRPTVRFPRWDLLKKGRTADESASQTDGQTPTEGKTPRPSEVRLRSDHPDTRIIRNSSDGFGLTGYLNSRHYDNAQHRIAQQQLLYWPSVPTRMTLNSTWPAR